jgi:hypothetical protein
MDRMLIGTTVFFGLNEQAAQSGIVHQSGGAVSVLGPDGLFNEPLVIGASGAPGSAYRLSGGTLHVPNGTLLIGSSGAGASLEISGGRATVQRLEIDGRTPTTPVGGSLRMSGGELVIGSGGMHRASDEMGNSEVNISGGTIAASASSTWTPGMNFENTATTIDTRANALTISGALVGPGGFTKTGSGTLTLTSTGSLVNEIRLNAGTLLVNGSMTGSVIAASGTTLKGTGTVGLVTLAGGATLAPGASPGILNVGSTSFNGGTLALELNGVNAGSQYDQLNVAGTVTIAANTPLTLSLGYNPRDHIDSFTIIRNDAAEPIAGSGLFTYNGLLLAEGKEFLASNQLFKITYAGGTDANDVILHAIPEPGIAAFLACALGAFGGLRRAPRWRESKAG